MSWACAHRGPAKGQGSGASRWPERVKVDLLADTSVGGPKPQRSKDPSITLTYLPCVISVGPRDAACYFSPASLPPSQRQIRASLHDKVLWKTRQRKERGSFQLPVGSKSSTHKRLWSHGSNLKLKGEMGTLDSPGPTSYQVSYTSLISNKDKLPRPWCPRSLHLIFKALKIMS